MNKNIKKELLKCKQISLPSFDDSTTIINIPKGFITPVTNVYPQTTVAVVEEQQPQFKEGVCYHIKLENYIINEPPNFTLSINWNQGTKPPETDLNIDIIKIMGKMVKVNAVGNNTNTPWEGWLPQKAINILEICN